MRRKFINILSIMLLCIIGVIFFTESNLASAKTSADFSDLKDLDAATKAKFDAMIEAGIFDGVEEGTFGLNDNMNRAQFAKVAALIFNLKVDTSLQTSSFSDVKADDPGYGYAAPYIEAIKQAGITDGYSPGKFNPAGEVSKEQLAAFLVRGLGWEKDAQATPGVNDDTVSDWAKGYVALALETKIMPNESDGKFGGTTNASRTDLVLSSYEAKVQYIPPKDTPVSVFSFQATDAKSLLVILNNNVDTSNAILSITVPQSFSSKYSIVWNDTKQATITFEQNLKAGNYTIQLSGLPDSLLGDRTTASVTVTDERLTKLEINYASETVPISKSVIIPFKAFNQYGKDMSDETLSSMLEFIASNAPASLDLKSRAVVVNTSSKTKGEVISVSVFETNAGVIASKTFKVGDPEIVQPEITEPEVTQPVVSTPSPAARPTANVTSGAVDSGTIVSLSSTDGASIYYTVDGSVPSTSSTLYTDPITVTQAVTIKAIAVKSGRSNSSVLTLIYTIKPQAASPTATVDNGAVDAGTLVSLNSADGASIYYTINGDTPDTSSTLYTGPISITQEVTIKAIAVKSGMTNSEVASFTYTINSSFTLPESIPSAAKVGQYYYIELEAIGATGSITYAITDGELPIGVELDSETGIIAGAPQFSGTYNFTISATDSAAVTVSMEYSLEVAEPVLLSLSSVPSSVKLTAIGIKQELMITAEFENYLTRDVTINAQYSSGNESVATVDAKGVVTAVASGDTIIMVTYGELSKQVSVKVTNERQLESISASLSMDQIAVGQETNFTVSAFFNDNSAELATTWVTLELDNPDVISIDDKGYITGLKPGTVNIKVQFLSEEKTLTLTVVE